jgi:hypothetical protein
LKKNYNHRRKQIENKVSSLEDYAVEVIQETEKILMLWGKRKFNPLNQKKKKKKTTQWKMNDWRIKLS